MNAGWIKHQSLNIFLRSREQLSVYIQQISDGENRRVLSELVQECMCKLFG